ncbi:MAG TPA: tripartite tricarboxylate transporter substrate binding protein [Casimicrobiaceae bacterium]|nr:tripartite tricarboxylate transporter substrate binding protein [Casimicrobiaceae bacterium]
MHRLTRLIATIGAAACLVAPFATPAALADYPDHPVRVISPYPPGGGVDAVARVIAGALTEGTGTSFVVENHGGASGRIGTEIAAKAVPDGYTLLLGSVGPNAIVPAAYPTLPYDALKSFAPISLVATSAYALVVPSSVPAKNVAELVALAKSQPGKINFGSTGNLGGPHLAGELLKLRANIDVVHVAYKGGGPMTSALLGKEITFAFASLPTIAGHVKAGTLRVLAVTGDKRAPNLPDVPTMAESIPGYRVLQWYGLLAPANTPPAIIAKLNAEVVKALQNPKIKESLARLDSEAQSSTPEAFQSQIAAELAQYHELIEKAGIKAE